ncbi:toxin-antitoxin system YwqK family antitoxin [Pontibacter sp. MBLB2868]|uniref:toxin-antitoxin system YwqK family antitoxin n=1 Tax=Pontibacter sp. MBLB2868 TaxID=3451555 RepID=UPI003F75432A
MRRYLLVIAIFVFPFLSVAQQQHEGGFWFFRTNRFDKEGNYHGRWKVYFGEDKVLIRNGRFRHGREVGIWKYYYPDGSLYMKEKYSRRSEFIAVEKYHENGKIARKGKALLMRTALMDRYFWTGEWQVFDENGTYSHSEVYRHGNLIEKKMSGKL